VKQLDRDILRLAVPAFGALAAEPLYVLADTAIIGHVGTPELGGLAVASTLILSGYSLFVFLAYGTTGTVARLLGAGERRRAARAGVQAMWLALGIGAALAVAGAALTTPLVDAMGATGEVATHARTYFRISMAGLPALTLVLAGTGYLRGLQDTRTPLLVAALSAVANLLLEIVFVVVLDLGVAGSAWATVIIQTVAAAVYVLVVSRDIRNNQVPVRPDLAALLGMVRVSRDLFLRTVALRGAFLVATATATRLGTVEVAAHEIAFATWSFLALALDSVAIAAQALVAHRLGASDAAGARAASTRIVQWGVGLGIAFAVVVLASSPWLAAVFTDDRRVVDAAVTLFVLVAVVQPVNGFVFALDGVLIGAGDQRYLAVAMAVIAVAFVVASTAVPTITWLWVLLTVFQVGRLVALARRWSTPRWLVEGTPA
jgi:putative MATE family efflux protein